MLVALLLLADALPPQGQLESSLLEAIAASCPRRKVNFDADLTKACRAWADAAREGTAPVSGDAVSFYASLESAEPSPVAGIATVSPPSHADRAVGELFPRSCHFNRVGVGAAEVTGLGAVVCALTADHTTDLARIPGRVEAGDPVDVTGRLGEGLTRPRLFVTRPGGAVEELKLSGSGRAFSGKVHMRQRGEHSLEVLADGPGGPQVVAVRRVFASVAPPTRPPPETQPGAGLAGVEAAIAKLRASRGLPALERDAELDVVAEGHSVEMVRLKTFAHVLPTDGNLSDRLGIKGYAYRSAGENIGLSIDVATAHEAIVGSPAHLANLLDPRHRRLGLGAAKGPTAEGGDGVYLTEVLAAPVVGSADPVGEVARMLVAARKKKGLPPLRRDATLDSLAGDEVRSAARKDGPIQLHGDLPGRAAQRDPGLERVAAEILVLGAPDEAARSKNLAEPHWKRLGVGAIYASSKTYGPGRLWVVLLYGR
jgi:uncharacterized protein YkwD